MVLPVQSINSPHLLLILFPAKCNSLMYFLIFDNRVTDCCEDKCIK